MNEKTDRMKELERQIEDLMRRWPAHSANPTMVQRLDELEEALKKAQEEAREGNAKAGSRGGL